MGLAWCKNCICDADVLIIELLDVLGANKPLRHIQAQRAGCRVPPRTYTPAFDKQRSKYGLTSATRGKFIADAWTGFRSAAENRSAAEGEPIERDIWENRIYI